MVPNYLIVGADVATSERNLSSRDVGIVVIYGRGSGGDAGIGAIDERIIILFGVVIKVLFLVVVFAAEGRPRRRLSVFSMTTLLLSC